MIPKEELPLRAEEYAQRSGRQIADRLGFGVHGSVFLIESQPETDEGLGRSAVKAHHREADYRREREVYIRLKENGVRAIRGYNVPRLLAYDDDLLIIEMTVVTRPYVLDFAGAFLDEKPDFSDEVLADWHMEKREQFGDKWPEAQLILRQLESYGIYVVDVNPNNIATLALPGSTTSPS